MSAEAINPEVKAEQKVDALIASYLSPAETKTDPVIDRSLNNIAAEAASKSASSTPASTSSASPVATVTVGGQSAAPKHPSSLLAWANKLNISQDEINSTPTTELWETVKQVHHLSTLHGDQTKSAPVVSQPTVKPVATGLDWTGVTDEMLDPAHRTMLDKAIAPLLAKIAKYEEMEAEVGGIKQFVQNQAAVSQFNAIDKVFNSLGAEFEPIFGKGSREEIGKAELDRRSAVLSLVPQGSSFTDIVAKAKAMFGGLAATPAAAATPPSGRDDKGRFATPSAAAEEWRQGQLAKPTGRNGAPEPKGDDRAARAIADLVAAGGGRSVNGQARLEDFPD